MALTTWLRGGAGFRDVRGHEASVHWWIGLDGGVGSTNDMFTYSQSIVSAIAAISNAQVVAGYGLDAIPHDPSLYGTSADYANVETKAKLSFLGSSRLRSTSMSIPAPLVAIFFSGGTGDRETVNPAATGVAALLAILTTPVNSAVLTLGPNTQETVHSLVIGKLTRVAVQRRIGKWTKDPTGTIPA